MSNDRSTTRGFALVAALFLIVVLAALGLFAVRLSSAQQQSINLAILGARAQAAANTGIEYAVNQALVPAIAVCNNLPLNLNQGALNGFTVNITCNATTHTINTLPPPPPLDCPLKQCPVYEISSTATSGTFGSPDFVSRISKKTVSKVPAP